VRKLGLLEKDQSMCCGLTLTQSHALVEIGRQKHMSVNELAQLLDLDKSTVSKVVEQLVKKSLLLRKTQAADRRFVALELTDHGKELFESTESSMERYYSGILAALPAVKQQQVIESLELLSAACEDCTLQN
jgi:DNA-binding MarR family transcriptional regulator